MSNVQVYIAQARPQDLPATFIGEAIAQSSHMVTDSRPFPSADNADILHRQDGEEQVSVGAVVPVLTHCV